MRVIAVKLTRPRHTEAAAAVRMIDEDKFATVSVGFFQRRELTSFGAEWSVCGECRAQTQNPERSTQNKAPIHRAITLLLSPNRSVSTPMRWAMRSSRLLMWASVFAGRLQSW